MPRGKTNVGSEAEHPQSITNGPLRAPRAALRVARDRPFQYEKS